jgi:DNA polymerase III subunit gamma/tau
MLCIKVQEYNKIFYMATEVFYRKWRPQILADVVGQEPVIQTLRYAVEKGKVAHAYLFCGPRGTGKTSTGRILAKAVNCLDQSRGEPCNECRMCKSITEGKSLDVVEIDAASNRGIDEVRSLREKVNYAPGSARYKVYIIDEVHMLTEAASNALLKTLEEPPLQVIFILATTEPQKVLSTIVSRCQRFNFHRLSQTAIVGKLQLICKEEGLQIQVNSLKLIARAATGSLRDAENILQQLFSYYGSQIDWEQVQTTLGVSDDPRIIHLVKHIIERDIPAGLKTICSVDNDGIDLRQFNQGLVQYLRGLMMVISKCDEALDVTDEDLEVMKKVADDVSLGYLLRVIKLFSGIDFHRDSCSTLPLELAFVDSVLPLVYSGDEKALEIPEEIEVVHSRHRIEQPSGTNNAAVANNLVQKLNLNTSEENPDRGNSGPQETELITGAKSRDESEVVDSSTRTNTPEAVEAPLEVSGNNRVCEEPDKNRGFDYVNGRWKEFIRSLRGEGSGGNLDAFLRSACELVSIEGDTLILGFYHSFHKEKIEDLKYRHLVEKKLEEVYNYSYKVKCILIERKQDRVPSLEVRSPMVKAALEIGAEIKNG